MNLNHVKFTFSEKPLSVGEIQLSVLHIIFRHRYKYLCSVPKFMLNFNILKSVILKVSTLLNLTCKSYQCLIFPGGQYRDFLLCLKT